MSNLFRTILLCLLAFGLAPAPVQAQSDSLKEYKGRLPENTIFYLSWDNLAEFDSLRASNPALRMLDSPEMLANWDKLEDYFRCTEEWRKRRRKASKSPEQEEQEENDSPETETAARPDFRWEDFRRTMRSPGLIALLASPEGETPGSRAEPEAVLLYDTSGGGDLIALLESRSRFPNRKKRSYKFEGLTVVETLNEKGRGVDYVTRIGRWLAGGSSKEVAEAWFRALQTAPAHSLKDAESFRRAAPYRNPSDQLEFFLNIHAIAGMIGRLPVKPGNDGAGLEPARLVEALGLNEWDFVLFSLGLEPERVRYALSGVYRPGAVPSEAVLGQPVTEFHSQGFAPANTLSYSTSRINLRAIWAYVERAAAAILPPKQSQMAQGMKGMIEGMLGFPVPVVLETLGPEFAQISYVTEGEGETQNLFALQVQNRERLTGILRTLFSVAASKATIEESTGEGPHAGTTYFRVAVPSAAPGEPPEPRTFAALTDEWLLVGKREGEVLRALERAGSGPSFGTSAAMQTVRSRLPAELSAFSFFDLDGWLASGKLQEFFREFTRETPRKTRKPATSPTSPVALREDGAQVQQVSRTQEPPDAAADPEPKFPELKFPRGFLRWLFSGTTRDAQGLYHIGVIE